MNRMLLVLRRELKELRLNRTFFQTMAVFPILMVLLPTATVLFFNVVITDFADAHSPTITGDCTQLGGLHACNKPQIIGALLAISFSFFLPVPAVLPMSIAAVSVVGEKERKSLEPLMVTPIQTRELVVGKSLSAIVPTCLLCWFSFAVLVLILRLLLIDAIITSVDIPLWLLTIGLWTPLLAFVTTMVGLAISARARDARAAQQSGSLMALPIVGLVIGIAFGFFTMSMGLFIVGLVILLALCFITYTVALRVFERENILTRWK